MNYGTRLQNFGSGYPFIILHGLFVSSENWQTLSRAWSPCYRVFAVDQRNHGHSPHSPAVVEDLREFMDAQRLSSGYIYAHMTLRSRLVKKAALRCGIPSIDGTNPSRDSAVNLARTAPNRPSTRMWLDHVHRLIALSPNYLYIVAD